MQKGVSSFQNIFRWVILLLILAVLALPRQIVRADPPDMYTQNQSVQLEADGLHIDWKILPGPVIADATWQAADLDHNNSISPQEAQAWVAPYIAEFSVVMDGQPLKHEAPSIHWPATVDVLRTGEDSIEINLLFKWPASIVGKHALEIHNAHIESNSLNWFSVTGQSNLSFDQPGQNNGQLQFNIYFPDSSNTIATPTALLTSWNSGTPNLPGFTNTITNMAVNLANPSQSSTTQTQTSNTNVVTSALIGLVKAQQFSPLFLLGAFLLSLILGSLHALTPGHGKTLVGAYLVGSQGRFRDAVFLGLIVTITHTGSVLLLGLITLIASHYILPTLITPWLEVISGLLVIGFGINLFIQRRRDIPSWTTTNNQKDSQQVSLKKSTTILPGTINTAHRHDHSLVLSQPHDHPHDQHGHHTHSHALPNNQVTWKSLLALGVSGGLVPCPDAIAILLVAVAVNRVPFGMLLIVAFSIGLALVLIGIGIAMVQGVRLISRSDLLTRFSIYAPIVSAVAVSGLGVALTISALNSFKFTSTISQSPSNQTVASNTNLQTSPSLSTPSSASIKLLYIASDSKGQYQLFMVPLAGGKPTQYTQEPSGIGDYSISPDHKTILYVVYNPDNSTTIWALNADGTQKRLVLNCPQAECDAPQWYPDNQKVVYERLDTQNSTLPRFSIWWLDTLTNKTQPVFQDQTFPSSAPKFSPDGQWLSYISPVNNMLMIYNLKDTRVISVPLNTQQYISENWSPTGDSLIFGNQVNSPDGGSLRIKRYVLASGQTIDLGGATGENDYSGAWSPDGSWIAIDRDIPTSDSSVKNNQVWLIKPDGTDSHVVLNENNASYSDLNWSPDGKFLIYSRYSYEFSYQNVGHFDIYMADLQTGKETLLVPGGDVPSLLP